jgi:hypothetical protein
LWTTWRLKKVEATEADNFTASLQTMSKEI